MSTSITISNTHIQEHMRYLALGKSWLKSFCIMVEEMCTSCARALDGVDDGERCISSDTWRGCGILDSISPHVRLRTCDVAFVTKYGHTCGDTRVDVFVSAVASHVWE